MARTNLKGLYDVTEGIFKEISNDRGITSFDYIVMAVIDNIEGSDLAVIYDYPEERAAKSITSIKVMNQKVNRELYKLCLVKADADDNYYIEKVYCNVDRCCFYNDYSEEIDEAWLITRGRTIDMSEIEMVDYELTVSEDELEDTLEMVADIVESATKTGYIARTLRKEIDADLYINVDTFGALLQVSVEKINSESARSYSFQMNLA